MTVAVRTRRITREQIAAAVGDNPRAVKLIESLTMDVTDTLPAAAQAAQDVAQAATIAAQAAITLANAINSLQQAQALAVSAESLREELHALRRRVAALEQGPNP